MDYESKNAASFPAVVPCEYYYNIIIKQMFNSPNVFYNVCGILNTPHY